MPITPSVKTLVSGPTGNMQGVGDVQSVMGGVAKKVLQAVAAEGV